MDEQIDLTQLDLNDPETRDWAQKNMDLSDPETKKYFDSFTASTKAPIQEDAYSSAHPKEAALESSLRQEELKRTDGSFTERLSRNFNQVVPEWYHSPETGNKVLDTIQNYGPDNIVRAGQAVLGAIDAIPRTILGDEVVDDPVLQALTVSPGATLTKLPSLGALRGANLSREALLNEVNAMARGGATRAEIDAWTDAQGLQRFGNDLDPYLAEIQQGKAVGDIQDTYGARVPLDENGPVANSQRLPEGIPASTALEEEAKAFKPAREPNAGDLWKEETPVDEQALATQLEDEVAAFKARKEAGETIDEAVPQINRIDEAVDHLNNTMAEWKNPPSVSVVNSVNEIEDETLRNLIDSEGGADTVKGVVGPDGKIHIIMDNIEDNADLNGVLFHEALGHNGLSQVFGEGLDTVLQSMYNSNRDFRINVDRWMEANPGAYAEHSNPVVRAADEVLAELSEQGIKDNPRLFDKLKNYIKTVGRKMGMKLDYSDREIQTILGMAHDAVINGKPDAISNGFRFSRRKDKTGFANDNKGLEEVPSRKDSPAVWAAYYRSKASENLKKAEAIQDKDGTFNSNISSSYDASIIKENQRLRNEYIAKHKEYLEKAAKKAEEALNSSRFARKKPIEKKTLSPEGMETQNDVSDLLDFTSSNLENIRPEGYTIPELKRMADGMGLNGSKYLEQKGFEEQQLAARLLRAKQIFANITDELAGLGEKLRTEGYSPSLHATIRQKLAQQEAIAAKLDNDTAEVGRALRVLQEVSQSRKTANAQMRFSKENAGDVLSDPDTLMRFMDNYNAIATVEGEDAAIKFLRKMRENNPIADVLNIPRSLMSSFDLSAPLRQGLGLIGRKEYWKNLPEMFKYFGSEKANKEMIQELRRRKTFPLMIKSGLSLSDDAVSLSNREEQFMSRLASNLPGVKHSERAYTGFLTKLRADTFDTLVNNAEKAGIDLWKDNKALKDIAEFINTATGRGELPDFMKGAAPVLNGLFFSPRLIASRVQMLNPRYYYKLSPIARREAIKSAVALGSIATTVASLASMAGADVETDPRSSDFAKIKVSDKTRYDILGGFGQYLTLGARLATNQKKKLSGTVETLGENPISDTRLDVLLKFAMNKESPVASFVTDYLRGQDAVGNKFSVTETDPMKNAITKRFIPLFTQDAYELVKQEGAAKGVGMALPGLFGVGVQNFE